MGFFSNLLKGVGQAIGILPPSPVPFGAQQKARLIREGRASAERAELLRRTARQIIPAVGRVVKLGSRQVDEGRGVPIGGNGITFRQTIVQTINRGTGEVEFEETLRGAPFLMRHEIQVAKRVIRTATKLGRLKGIRHTVKQSVTSRTKEAIENKILAAIGKDVC